MITGLQTVVGVTLPFVRHNDYLYMIWVMISFCFLGAHFSIFPTVFARIYGMKTGVSIYPIVFIAIALDTILGFILQYFVVAGEKNQPGKTYNPAFYILSAMTLVAFLLCLVFKDKPVYKEKP